MRIQRMMAVVVSVLLVASTVMAQSAKLPSVKASTSHPMLMSKSPELVLDLLDQLKACPALPPRISPPTHVADLRPDDISVIMAMGDSILCGLNARYTHLSNFDKDILKSARQLEFRGANFATGADSDVFSIAKIINTFRKQSDLPPVIGMSRRNHSLDFCYGPICPAGTFLQPFKSKLLGLNAAQAGSWVTRHNINNQFEYLDNNALQLIGPHITEPWKLMIFEGGFNNLCIGCKRAAYKMYFNAVRYENSIRYMINGLRRRYKRMVVVMTAPFAMSQIYDMIQKDPVCAKIRGGSETACPCLSKDISVNHPIMDKLAAEYNRRLMKIAAYYRKKKWNDFAVVFDTGLGRANFTGGKASEVLSGYDCFHPNVRSHAQFASNLWNNLFLPQKDKQPYSVRSDITIRCPTADDRIILD